MLQALRTILPLGLAAGINLYLTVLVIGLSIRFAWVTNVPPGLEILASEPILIIAGILYAIEFIADKIPVLDSLWDLVHTVIRPAGSMVIATTSLEADPELVGATAQLVGVNPAVELTGALVACGIALLSHSGKAGTRTAVNVSGAGFSFAGVFISLLEDLAVAAMVILALRYPLAANVIAGIAIVVLLMVVPQLLRWSWFTLRALGAWVRARVAPRTASDTLPQAAQALVPAAPQLVLECRAALPGLRGRSGFLVELPDQLLFVYRRWWRWRSWSRPDAAISAVSLRRRVLLYTLEVRLQNANEARFALTADRASLAERLVTGPPRP